MTRPIKAFHKSLSLLKEDKVILLLSFIPVLIGIIAYYYIGNFFYVDLLDWGKNLVAEKVGNSEWLSYVAWIFTAILTVILYFLVSWTFVLFVSIISSPFNDIISGRVEKRLLGEASPDFNTEKFFKRVLTVLINESKKISFIVILSILSFILGLFFPPVAFGISALLLSISFLDYAWSRKDLSFGECIDSLRKSFLTYLLTGCVFMGLISMPILNLFILPFAVIYYSVLFYSKENGLTI